MNGHRTKAARRRPGPSASRDARRACRSWQAFTLIELMIVVALMGVMMAVGVPAFIRARHSEGFRKAVNDVVEACNEARALAILRGEPMEVVIVAEDGLVRVQPATVRANTAVAAADNPPVGDVTPAPRRAFPAPAPRQIPDDVAIELLDVNFVNHMNLPEAHVRFYPNGTSDEFTLVLLWEQKRAKISLEVVTGLVEAEYL
jgi:prepilin-type N-terminal cleavage/methylation domain-containing protein